MGGLCLCVDCMVFGCVPVNVRHSVGFWMFLRVLFGKMCVIYGIICGNVWIMVYYHIKPRTREYSKNGKKCQVKNSKKAESAWK